MYHLQFNYSMVYPRARFNVSYHQYADDTQPFISLNNDISSNVNAITTCNAAMKRIGNCDIPVCDTLKTLGVVLDKKLTFSNHIKSIIKACNYHIKLDYCNSIMFGISQKQETRLQKLMNRAAKVVLVVSIRNDGKGNRAKVVSEELTKKVGGTNKEVSETDVTKFFRLKSKDNAPRLLLVKFDSRMKKNLIMENLYKIKSLDEDLKKISISHDLNKEQREERKKLVNEAIEKQKLDKGAFIYRMGNARKHESGENKVNPVIVNEVDLNVMYSNVDCICNKLDEIKSLLDVSPIKYHILIFVETNAK
ncbi:hypothetical protein HELRODRAFT_182600 [Helobdella robusta]|uniref:Reverse transcriptase domain-containing protein n=1 Tax=Helobdella robusta TaxID=6412 RepID=T1FIG1_HELRO|nr:hypothetical protein HELRODRAFT_182600 [Helobdella robusta]ESN90772.1 hypothetical protein HELRODRAFT_182600 [Helobdella robusta]